MTDEFLNMPRVPDKFATQMDLYQSARPFPHAIIDDFTDPVYLREVVNAIESVPKEKWTHCEQHADQLGKTWISDPDLLPEPARTFLHNMNAAPMVKLMSELTGIPDLIADPTYLGGGVHSVDSGGRLEIHADFNLHPNTISYDRKKHDVQPMHRRVNALLYLNEGWKREWGGDLELWEKDMSACAVKIAPTFNRLVVFTITDDAFHGHPQFLECPPWRRRLSLALYYYTRTRPAHEQAPFHWASWQRRPPL